jgi:uncharacterized protein YeaO (DUF488 family)
MIKLKRAYVPASSEDGFRILVERLWPRGVSKEEASLDEWLKEIAPSPELRKWYGHALEKWEEFRRRYNDELKANPEGIRLLEDILARQEVVTFVYAAKDEEHNSALVLKEFLEKRP